MILRYWHWGRHLACGESSQIGMDNRRDLALGLGGKGIEGSYSGSEIL